MTPELGDLLAVAAPAGTALGATAVFLGSTRRGRPLVDDVLRGAGVGGILGTTAAFVIWAVAQAAGT